VESIDLGAAFGRERRVLFHVMGVKAVNPENRVIDTIADAIRPVFLGNLRDPAEPERAQNYIVKGGGARDVRDTDTSVVDHCNTPNHLARWGHQLTTRSMQSTSFSCPGPTSSTD